MVGGFSPFLRGNGGSRGGAAALSCRLGTKRLLRGIHHHDTKPRLNPGNLCHTAEHCILSLSG